MPSCNPMPRRLPATAIWYSGAFSQKYFRDVKPIGMIWISSKIIRVFSGFILTPEIAEKARISLSVLKSLKTAFRSFVSSQFIYATDSYSFSPKSFRSQVFPTE